MQTPPGKIKSIVGRILIAVIALAVGAFLFAWSGVYNVAASSGHWRIVEVFLSFGMRQSVALRARGFEEPNLDSRDLIALGAGHFERGCAFCHGSPDKLDPPVAHAMLPPPPSLSTHQLPWTSQELFWIIRHGIKYTGMPAWPALERADEIWAMVAFVRKLPSIDADAYRALALPKGRQRKGPQVPGEVTVAEVVRRCVSCHGDGDSGPESALVPRLHGQRKAFLASALRQYASRARPSGIMQPVAAELDPREIDLAAKFYAELSPVAPSPLPSDDVQSALGRTLATEGDPARRIPACTSCHRRDAYEAFPSLDGQSATYLVGQLRLWKSGHNTLTHGAAIMAPIALRLEDRDIEAVARYFAGKTAQEAAERQP